MSGLDSKGRLNTGVRAIEIRKTIKGAANMINSLRKVRKSMIELACVGLILYFVKTDLILICFFNGLKPRLPGGGFIWGIWKVFTGELEIEKT